MLAHYYHLSDAALGNSAQTATSWAGGYRFSKVGPLASRPGLNTPGCLCWGRAVAWLVSGQRPMVLINVKVQVAGYRLRAASGQRGNLARGLTHPCAEYEFCRGCSCVRVCSHRPARRWAARECQGWPARVRCSDCSPACVRLLAGVPCPGQDVCARLSSMVPRVRREAGWPVQGSLHPTGLRRGAWGYPGAVARGCFQPGYLRRVRSCPVGQWRRNSAHVHLPRTRNRPDRCREPNKTTPARARVGVWTVRRF